MLTAKLLMLVAAAGLPRGGDALSDAANWVHADDFPSAEWPKEPATRYELMIDVAGHPVSCIVTEPSGSPIIDRIACKSLMERARYTPARDAQGHAVPQAIRVRLQWRPDPDSINRQMATADLAVKSPAVGQALGNVAVTLALMFDSAGRIERCAVIKRAAPARLNQQACDAASKAGTFAPVRDAKGATTRGLRKIEVIFSHGERWSAALL